VPTLLLYHGGEMRQQIVGLGSLGGQRLTPECVEWVLARHGAVTSELDEDPRKRLERGGGGGAAGRLGGRGGGRAGEEDEED